MAWYKWGCIIIIIVILFTPTTLQIWDSKQCIEGAYCVWSPLPPSPSIIPHSPPVRQDPSPQRRALRSMGRVWEAVWSSLYTRAGGVYTANCSDVCSVFAPGCTLTCPSRRLEQNEVHLSQVNFGLQKYFTFSVCLNVLTRVKLM